MERTWLKGFISDDDLLDIIGKDIKWARDYRDERTDDWERFYKLYKGYIDQVKYPFEANLSIPNAYSNTEVQVAFLLDMIFEGGDFLEVLGKTEQGQLSARAVKDMLNYHFRHSFHIYEDMEQFIRQLLMYGTSIYKVFYDYRREWKTRHIPEYSTSQEFQKYKEVLSSEEVAHNPTGYVVDLWNFGADPNAPDMRGARFAFEELWFSPETLIQRQELGIFKNVEKVLGEESCDVNDGLDEKLNAIDIDGQQRSPYIERGKIHCVDYWGYVTKGWKEDGRLSKKAKSQLIHAVLVVGNSTASEISNPVLLLAEPSPFNHNRIPFVDARINACVGEFYGTGDIEMCESLYLEQRDHRNVQMDNLNRTINQMWKAKRGSVLDYSQLTTRPNGVIEVDEMDNLVPVALPPVDPAHFKVQDDIRRDIEMVTGVNDFVMGQYRSTTGFNDTATGISLIQQTALKRLGQKGQVVQRSIKDIGSMAYALVAQYQPYGTSVRILDKESAVRYRFIDISPEALMQEYDFNIVNAPALGSKALRQQQLLQLLQIVMQTEQAGGMSPQVGKLYKRILDEMDIPNPQELAGFPGFNSPLPQVPEAGEGNDWIAPDEENRLMLDSGQSAHAKMGEDHPQHIFVHQDAYDASQNNDGKTLLNAHIQEHHALMQQEKSIIAMQMGTEAEMNAVTEMSQQASLTGAGGKSPSRAQGNENVTRDMGALLSGNA